MHKVIVLFIDMNSNLMLAVESVTVLSYLKSMLLLFQTHSGSVWRVTWAHPEFGQVLATCSFDRTGAIWEEQGKCVLNVIKYYTL